MNVTLRNPSAKHVSSTIFAALATAQKGARTRRVDGIPTDLANRIITQSDGVYAADGGGVCNSYKYAAETTDLVVSWWTGGNGTRTVRIHAARTRANHSSHGSGSGTASPRGDAWQITFPDRAAKLRAAGQARIAKLLDRIGPAGDDDRLAIIPSERHLSALADAALIVADHPERPRVVQVVVRDSTTGQRHHITVPPKFARPDSATYQRLGSDAARIQAALAWTFRLQPAQYAPAIEA